MELARDTFTDTAYTVLSTHAEELNAATWAGFYNSNRILISAIGRVFRSAYNPNNGLTDQILGADSFLSYSPSTDNYIVSALVTYLGPYLTPGGVNGFPADFPDDGMAPGRISFIAFDSSIEPGGPYSEPSGLPAGIELVNGQYINKSGVNNNPASGSNHRVYIYARIQNSPQHQCYCFGYESSGGRYVLCKDQTDIASDGPVFVGWNHTVAAAAWATNETRLFELKVNGNDIEAYVDGVLVLSDTQTDYASGKTGFEFKGGSSPVRGFHLDDFKVHSLSGGPSITYLPDMFSLIGSEGVTLNVNP